MRKKMIENVQSLKNDSENVAHHRAIDLQTAETRHVTPNMLRKHTFI